MQKNPPQPDQTDFKPFRQFSQVDPAWAGVSYRDLAKPLGLSEDQVAEVSSTLTNVTVLGVGTTSPTTTLEVASQTSPQFTIRYDTSNYATFGVDSAGKLTITPSGTDITGIGRFYATDGTAALPSYSFTTQPSVGWYVAAAGTVSLGGSSAEQIRLGPSAISIFSNTALFRMGATLDVILARDAANALALRNGTNAQTFSVYNTFTAGTPDYERLEFSWSANVAQIKTGASGTGTARTLRLLYGNSTSPAIDIPTVLTSPVIFGNVSTSNTASFSAMTFTFGFTGASGTHSVTTWNSTFSDNGNVSTALSRNITLQPTINYTGATRTGSVYLQYLNPTLTSIPTGNNAGISFSSAFTNASFPAMRLWNTADEVTDAEWFEMGWHIGANVYGFRTNKGGTGVSRTLRFYYGGTTTSAVVVDNTVVNGLILGSGGSLASAGARVIIGNTANMSATSGTLQALKFTDNCIDGGTNSTTAVHYVLVSPTINYTGASRTGYFYGLYLNTTNTSLATGINAAIALSSTAQALNGIVWNNQTDEQTNYENVKAYFTGNTFTLGSYKGGTGTLRGLQLGVTSNAIGFLGATPVTQKTGGENVTNNVTNTASTDGTIPDITNGAVYATDYTNLRNALYQLARLVKQDHDALRAYGLLS